MINSHGQLVAQHDAQPDLGGFPTSTWQEGEVIPDRHSLSIPADATAGSYTLLVGFYDQSTGERERLTDAADFVELQTKINILSP